MKGIKDIIVKGSIFAILSAVFCLGGAFMSLETAWAEDCAEIVGRGSYSDVQTALNQAWGGQTVRLLKDVGLGSPLLIEEKKVTLDLNGHTIDRGLKEGTASEGFAIKVFSNGELTLTDSSEAKTGLITGGNSDTYSGAVDISDSNFYMKGGTISGNKGHYGGGVSIYGENSKFYMEGGTISGNTADCVGGGVYIGYGEFYMEGGSICGNTAKEYGGGGVYVDDGEFYMEGGSICGNTVKDFDGGGVSVNYNSVFTMNGGKISFNSAKYGGGASIGFDSEFNMTGGTITLNTAAVGGGAVDNAGVFRMTGGTITFNTTGTTGTSCGGLYTYSTGGRTCLSGSTEIYGNVKGGTITDGVLKEGSSSNIHVQSDKENTRISILGEMKNKTPIGVTLVDDKYNPVKGVFAKAGDDYNEKKLTADDLAHFKSDIYGYVPKLNEDFKGELVTGYSVSVNNGFGSGLYAEGATVKIEAEEPAEGKVFDKWKVCEGGVSVADETKSETSFIMPANGVTVEATYKDKEKDMEKVSAPAFSPKAGTYKSAQSVTISSETSGAVIYYTDDGSTPTASGTKYSGPVSVTKTTTIKAIAVKADMLDSDVTSATYTIGSVNPGITKYRVTVNNGSGDGEYEEDATVKIKADAPADGKVFDKWTSEDGVEFANAVSPETTFMMPGKDVTVAATYKDKGEDKPDPDDPDDPGTDDPSHQDPEPEKKPDKVPVTDPSTSAYASSEDNFAPVAPGSSDGTGGDIKKLLLDFSQVKASGVDPNGLRMTVIAGSKFRTKVKDRNSVKTEGGIKAKFNKKDGTATITCKKNGKAIFEMEDGTYTVNFTVEKPKPNKNEKKMPVGSGTVNKTIKALFGTTLDSGTLTAQSKKGASKVSVSGNALLITPEGKDTIKVQYQYLNKKYKMNIKVK